MIELIIFSIIKTKPNIIFVILLISHLAKNISQQYTKIFKTIFK